MDPEKDPSHGDHFVPHLMIMLGAWIFLELIPIMNAFFVSHVLASHRIIIEVPIRN
jgi:hypothetical protein